MKGERSTNTNLRYKVGRNLGYDGGDVFAIRQPEEAGLPRPNVSSAYIFAREDDFLVYPNNYNHFAQYFRDTFQHGGISLEEVIIPWWSWIPFHNDSHGRESIAAPRMGLRAV